jgi:ubiquinone biosynthesis protein
MNYKHFSSLFRLYRIIAITARYRLDLLLQGAQLPRSIYYLLRFSPLRLLPVPKSPPATRIREALQDLGPIFIKFGQMLSTRRDLLSPEMAEELAKLQDEVPPFGQDEAVAIIESALGKPVDELFMTFSPEPLASASIAQVHAATLPDGRAVVVKVVRPGINETIAQDIGLLHTLATLLQRFVPDGRRLRPVEVVNDYKNTIFDELDMQKEAANTSVLRRNFIDSDMLYIPEIYWDYTRRNVLVMERVEGIPIADTDAIRDYGINMKALAERGVELFFTQVFRDNFFHADMHPGNIFIARSSPESPQYIGIDCAIMGSLSDFDQYYLARNLLAIFERDYRQVAQLHVECGWVPPHTRVQDFEAAMRSTCEPIFEKPLGEISFGQLLLYLFQTARRFDMEIQPSLVLLQKTLLAIEGLGRELYPQLDLWQTARPFLANWLQQRYAPQGILDKMLRQAPQWLEQLPLLPEMLIKNLQQRPMLDELLEQQQQQLAQLQLALVTQRRQRRNWVLAAIAAGAALLLAQPAVQHSLAQMPAVSWALLGLALVLTLRR